MKKVIDNRENTVLVTACQKDKVYAFNFYGEVCILVPNLDKSWYLVSLGAGFSFGGTNTAPTLQKLLTSLIKEKVEVYEFNNHKEFGVWLAAQPV